MLWILIWWYVAISFNGELSSIQHIVWYLVPYSFRSLSAYNEFRINFDTKRGFQLNSSRTIVWVILNYSYETTCEQELSSKPPLCERDTARNDLAM